MESETQLALVKPEEKKVHIKSGVLATTEQGFKQQLTEVYGIDVQKVQEACTILPKNYDFEIWKTLYRVMLSKSKYTGVDKFKVALQFPEGLIIYSTLISDLIQKYCEADTIIMGDVTYGACCIDDLGARALGAHFMVHYAHSCLVPIQEMVIKDLLYVFVTIGINLDHFVKTILHNLCDEKESNIYLFGTIQFTNSLFMCRKLLTEEGFKNIMIPQTKPRSSGEVLGCTAPRIPESTDNKTICIFLADGRFHIESTMIHNPHIEYFYQYDPYSRKFTKEKYDIPKMQEIRTEEIDKAKHAKVLGIILGTLGRQGNTGLLDNLRKICKERKIKHFILLLSEVTPQKLEKFSKVDAWIQICCPRLSVDWGHYFKVPVLNTYEGYVLLEQIKWQKVYPMDFYSNEAGEWGVYYKINKEREEQKALKKKQKVKIQYENV